MNLRELWAYRDLLYTLMWRDLKVRYKQTVLGGLWVLLQPLILTLMFTLVLGRLANMPSDGAPYPVFVYAGLLPWMFFQNAVSSSGNSVVWNANLITKIYFPRLVIPAAAVAARLVDLAVALTVLVGLLIYYGVPLKPSLLMLPVLVLILTVFSLAVGIWNSALNVKYRDIGIILPMVLQLWMYASPVVYPSSLVPARWQTLYSLNPLVGMIDGFRSAVLGRSFELRTIGLSCVVTIVVLLCSAFAFRRMEKSFADVV